MDTQFLKLLITQLIPRHLGCIADVALPCREGEENLQNI